MGGSSVRAAGGIARLVIFLVVSALAGTMVAGLALPVLGAAGLAARATTTSFDSLPADLATPPLAQRSRILDAKGHVVATFYEQNRVIVDYKNIAPNMINAIIAIEDSRFREHGGVDLRGTLRALVNNQSTGTTQGGSTLTQQYVKQVLLDQAVDRGDEAAQKRILARSGPEGVARKIQELRYAIGLEDKLSKNDIVTRYLNIAFFGSHAYGIEAAAQRYFSRHAKDLTLPQAATLAGIVKAPSAFDPTRHPKDALARRNVVIARMAELGRITPAQAAKARKSSLGLKPRPVSNGCSSATAAFFCDYVYRVLLNDPGFGPNQDARERKLWRGGLTIRTTLDPRIQAAAQKSVDSHIPRTDKSGIGTAISIVQPGTGKVLAMAQNRTWGTKGKGTTTLNYNVDKQYGGGVGFQPGSTMKVVTAAAALNEGMPINTRILANTRTSWSGYRDCQDRPFTKPYAPPNDDNSRPGFIDMAQGMANSVNAYFAGLERKVGLCDTVKMAQKLGVHRADGTELHEVPSFTLGVNEVSPLTMAELYATLAARGMRCDATPIISIADHDGKAVKFTKGECKQVIDQSVADGVLYTLQAVMQRGTGRQLHIGRPVAGKTGTTDDHVAVWFDGVTPNMAASVWVGDPGHREGGRTVVTKMSHLTINGRYYSGNVFGSSVAGPIWEEAMKAAVEKLPVERFDNPDNVTVHGDRITVPSVIGMGPQTARQVLEDAGFSAHISASKVSSNSVGDGGVAYTSPGNGAVGYVGTDVTIYVSNGNPPFRPRPPAPRATPRATATATATPAATVTAKPTKPPKPTPSKPGKPTRHPTPPPKR